MRGQYIDGPTAKAIVARARMMREAAGRLTGYALGQDDDAEVRSFAADVLIVFGDDEKLWCETIADRLAGSIPRAPTPTSPRTPWRASSARSASRSRRSARRGKPPPRPAASGPPSPQPRSPAMRSAAARDA